MAIYFDVQEKALTCKGAGRVSLECGFGVAYSNAYTKNLIIRSLDVTVLIYVEAMIECSP